MRRNYGLISFVLLISTVGVLLLTASEYVGCKDFYPDEFLDLALAWQYPSLIVFAPYLDNHPYLYHSLKGSYFRRIDLLTPVLRC